MPGFPLVNTRDANTPDLQIPQPFAASRLPQPSVLHLERMPFHQNAAEHGLHGFSASALPIGPIQLPPTHCNAKSLTLIKNSSGHVGAQLAAPYHGSADSEHDLAAMVHDFMENGSLESDFPESSDGESGLPSCSRLFETLQALRFNATLLEKELMSILSVFLPSVKDVDLFCLTSGRECKGACIQQMLVKHLRVLGYDAAVCSSRWQNSGKVPGGEYEYLDVLFEGEKKSVERLIVDVDFQSQFEIARPTHSYAAALKCLPVIFVGSEEKLRQVLQVMAEAAKISLKQNSMPLPPWRTLEYMLAKWLSPFERTAGDSQGKCCRDGDSSACSGTGIKQCAEQLKNLKLCMVGELDKYHIQKPVNLERNRMLYFATRPLSSGFAVS